MQLKVFGIVQGVGFRPFVYRIASELGYSGYVRNNGSNVEIVLDGDHKKFLDEFWAQLPPLAQVDHIEKDDGTTTKELMTKNGIENGEFKILMSTEGVRQSAIPPDTALCDDCKNELFNPEDRRYLYPFINCTNCGARFSVISNMPYDREKTSMNKFKLCALCTQEFTNPANRRMHAQTISCPEDGPKFSLFTKGGVQVPTDNPIKEFAHELDKSVIGIIKSWGGMHIVSTIKEIERLRDWYKRPEKPFAVMARDIKAAEKYCVLDNYTKYLLNLVERPIVLVPKRKDIDDDKDLANSLELISPGLDTIGLYLPYSAIQYLLFNYLKHDAIIMTSANPRGEPLVMNNTEVFELDLDLYLIHDREIINRVDDSLIVPHSKEDGFYFIRKSRGFVPLPIEVNYNNTILSFGAESNVTVAISKKGKLYTSQYIGNTNYYKTSEFFKEASKYLMRLLGIKQVDAVAFDLHPQYPTRKLALEFAQKYNVKTFELQHHWSHAASLMLDNNLKEPIIAITLDGAGYGPDGTIWGGEILYSNYDRYKHLGSLELIPLIGGDMAVYHPERLVFGIFEELGLDSDELNYFPSHTSDVFRKMVKTSPKTSSFGRILDSLSCYFGISTTRTYDGEPAMKLERYLAMGKPDFYFETEVTQQLNDFKRIQTLSLFKKLVEYVGTKNPINLPDQEKANLCHSFVSELVRNLVRIALDATKIMEVNYIGLSGGVTYNIPIVNMIKKEFSIAIENGSYNKKLKFLTHSRLPNGDGGISAGQNVIAGHMLACESGN